jgi:transposase-like protein/IS1 family transposase
MLPHKARRTIMDPTTTFCPNLACPARGQTGQGNIGIHSRKDRRFICKQCRKTFTATKGTVFYRLRTAAELVVLVVTLLAHGCPLQAIVAAFRLDERTVADWWARAGQQGQAVQEYLVEQPRDLGHVQADEIRVKTQGGIVWMALAMMIRTRLWLAGEVSAQRDMPLIRRLIERVRRCATHRPLLFCTDGLCAYIRAIRETFRDPERTGAHGRPRLRPWRNVCIAQVVKRYTKRRVVDVERRIVDGTPARVETLRRRSYGDGVINTAYIERLNATFRERLTSLTRRGRALARRPLTLHHGMYLIGTVYNFCTPHASLDRVGSATTPAMAAGITEHCWSVRELLSYHVPPPRWTPPTQRGRPSHALKRLIERWCGDHG